MKDISDYPRRLVDIKCSQCGGNICSCLLVDNNMCFCGLSCYHKYQQRGKLGWKTLLLVIVIGICLIVFLS